MTANPRAAPAASHLEACPRVARAKITNCVLSPSSATNNKPKATKNAFTNGRTELTT